MLELVMGNRGQVVRPDTTELLGQLLENNLKFAKDKMRNLYIYYDGVYKLAKDDISVCCMEVFAEYNVPWRIARDKEIHEYLLMRAPEMLDQPLSDRLNLLNGIYYIESGKFEHHSEVDHSDYLTVVQIPINYDPSATCPNIDKFMCEVFPEGPALLYDIIGLCMTPVMGLAKAVILLGSGSNGKSVFLYGLRSALGMDNVSTITMHGLADGKDKFITSGLVGKLANAADDMSQDRILDTANIKSIISGNPIRVEGKYKSAVNYLPFCKLVFGSNHRLESNDDTTGYTRRIMHIPFNQTFPPNAAKERELHEAWTNPIELSGLLNEVLKRLKWTLAYGFDIPETARDMVDNFVPISASAKAWLLDNVIEDPEGKIPTHNLYVYCLINGEHDGSKSILAGHIKYLFPGVKHGRTRINGKQYTCYLGIRMKSDELAEFILQRIGPESLIDSAIGYLDPDGNG